MNHREKTYQQWLQDMQHFQAGPWGWLLIVLTLLVIGPLVAIGLFIFPPGRYPRFILLIPGFALGAAFFFGLGPVFYRLDQRSAAAKPAPPAAPPAPTQGLNKTFTNELLPALAFKDPMPLLSMSSFPKQATERIREVWAMVARDQPAAHAASHAPAEGPDGGPRWDTVFVAARPCGLIELPPPQSEGEAYFVALVFNLRAQNGQLALEPPFISYFLLTRPSDDPNAAAGGAALVRRHEDGRHEWLRGGLPPDRDAFVRAVDEACAGRLGPSFLKPDDLQKLIEEE